MSRALGRYELLRPLARGGMAEVYLARRRAAGVEKWLVVKRMRPERAGDARFLDLFVREARLSMSLAHQNIVPVFDFGKSDDQVFLAMERIEGKDLGSSLAKAQTASRGPMPPLLAAFVAHECCQALDYAHHRKGPDGTALGVVHRDVTPRNVLLSWSGEVKLTDFGIAALAGDDTNRLIGTPAYMAPEQARGEPVDARADVYGLGLVLREALTGERARGGADRDAIVALARKAELSPWPAGVPEELVAIADRATAAAPSDRYPGARSMLEDLDGFIVSHRAATKAETPARQLAAWLTNVWGEERESSLDDASAVDGDFVSFVDDGGLGVIGTGTERSLLATAAEIEALPDATPPAAASSPKLDAVAPAGATMKIPARRVSRAPMFVIVGVVIAAIVYVGRSRHGEEPSPPPSHVDPAPPPTAPTQPPPNVPTNVAPPVVQDTPTKVDPTPPPKPPIKQTSRPTPTPPKPIDAHAGSAKPADTVRAPVAERHRVTINSQPWSYFTVDDDATQHQTVDNLMLPAGTHRIRFTNPQLKLDREITLDVPDHDITHVEKLSP